MEPITSVLLLALISGSASKVGEILIEKLKNYFCNDNKVIVAIDNLNSTNKNLESTDYLKQRIDESLHKDNSFKNEIEKIITQNISNSVQSGNIKSKIIGNNNSNITIG